ncbi:hypothetical protein CI102_15163 [Trichoderma harzianum]|uniref:Uncharacterized protein n=1 Tax=Trichoderma harzianum CBS 226.95 TaxID=983964 RepID=A0A2T4AKE6_TRIHA|nr:hypothetical protein M431DRAFT_2644 [Trichoderma harzianum CBS 226.95]PKK41138.1 hypothetical protein CI102_15163 [Trichoderma harzianum]PTB57539.1 hypothetical protein M431DRAFT_2644 [Trichoderma harzianum CBS 226.95]
MITHASAQKEEKADCQSPKDESPTNDERQPLLQREAGELAIKRSRVDVINEEKLGSNERKKLKEKLFPWAAKHQGDVLAKMTQNALFRRYFTQRRYWSREMVKDFHIVAPDMDYSIWERCRIADHPIGKEANAGRATWIHAWFLQVLFGNLCEKHSWFEGLKKKYPDIYERGLSRPGERDPLTMHRARVNSLRGNCGYEAREIIKGLKVSTNWRIQMLFATDNPDMEANIARGIESVLFHHVLDKYNKTLMEDSPTGH